MPPPSPLQPAIRLTPGSPGRYGGIMDAATIRVVADIARKRAQRADSGGIADGMARLGAQRALEHLAIDLEISAAELERPRRKPRRSN